MWSTLGPEMQLRFGDCLLDTERCQLLRAGEVVPLSPKAFDLLTALAERRPQVVEHAELRRLVWPDTTAGGTTLARLVSEVRSATGDDADEPRYIRTASRRGYAFCSDAVDEAPRAPVAPPGCAVEWAGRWIPLRQGQNVIGRGPEADVNIGVVEILRRHARITVDDGRAVVQDLGSRHGTRVNGRVLAAATELRHGDVIQVGPVPLVFHDSRGEDPTL